MAGLRLWRSYRKPGQRSGAGLAFPTATDRAHRRDATGARVHEEVFEHAEPARQAFLPAAARHETDAAADGLRRAADRQRLALERHPARLDRERAVKGAAEGVMASAAQPDEAERLAASHRQRHRADTARAVVLRYHEAVDLQQHGVGRRGRREGGLRQGAPDDPVDELRRRGRRDGAGRDAPPVPEHRQPVRDPEHLVEAMRHVNEPDAARLQAHQRVEEPFDIGRGQRRGRLVEHQEIRAARQRSRDRHDRLVGRRQGPDPGLGIDPAAHAVEGRACGSGCRAPVDQTAPPGIAGQHRDVLGHRHGVDEAEVLVDEGDGHGVGARCDVLPLPAHPAFGRRIDPGQDLDQRRLAGAVLAQKRVDFAPMHVEIDVVERQRAGELLDDAAELEEGGSRFGGAIAGSLHGATPQSFR